MHQTKAFLCFQRLLICIWKFPSKGKDLDNVFYGSGCMLIQQISSLLTTNVVLGKDGVITNIGVVRLVRTDMSRYLTDCSNNPTNLITFNWCLIYQSNRIKGEVDFSRIWTLSRELKQTLKTV